MKKLGFAIAAAILISSLRTPAAAQPAPPNSGSAAAADRDIVTMDKFISNELQADPDFILPNKDSQSSFGFTKSILDTPRSVDYLSSQEIELLGITNVEDLMRAIPGVDTNFRYGLQGGVWVRGVVGDTYWRGMKELTQLGTTRTTFDGMDSIEIVKGPPAPIYGMGKIGGYTNYVPKAGRSATGAYLTKPEGFIEANVGSYQDYQTSFGIGGPFNPGGKQGGYYIYGLVEDGNTFVELVPTRQKILQGSVIVADAIGKFRLESGGQYQNADTAGGFMNRITQEEVNNGTYIEGMPLVNLDTNGDGKISLQETYTNSPVKGALSSTNQPLLQRFAWPTTSNGSLVPLGQFPQISGIPQSLYTYLTANPSKDPTGLMRAQGVGAPLPVSGYLPIGFALDPTTIGTTKIDRRRNGGLESTQDSKVYIAYLDLINDSNPGLTIKNQMFFYKLVESVDSYNPFAEVNNDYCAEDKFTVTKRFEGLPDWLAINSLFSANLRHVEVKYESGSDGGQGDLIYRNDVMRPGGNGMGTPNTEFWNWITNPSLAPPTSLSLSDYYEEGAGVEFDTDIFKNTNLITGIRYDDSPAKFVNYGVLNPNTGNALDPSTYTSTTPYWGGSHGPSESVSLSQQLPFGIRPYVTWSKEAVSLEGDNDVLSTTTIAHHLGYGKLLEGGVKASLLNNKLFVSGDAYFQYRSDVQSPTDPQAGDTVTATDTRGFEAEVRWVPTPQLSITGYGQWQNAHYAVNTTTTEDLPASWLGFKNVVNPATGQVIYPADAFLYGGVAALILPANDPLYRNYNEIPERQFGLNGNYRFHNGLGFMLGGTSAIAFWDDRLRTLKLPAATVINTGVSWDGWAHWHYRLNVSNVGDVVYYRPRNRDYDSERISAMPGRRWQVTAKYDF
jgi:outer membrane receptor protein involved in Fe transport